MSERNRVPELLLVHLQLLLQFEFLFFIWLFELADRFQQIAVWVILSFLWIQGHIGDKTNRLGLFGEKYGRSLLLLSAGLQSFEHGTFAKEATHSAI